MDNITIPVDDVVKNGLSINEYLLLYSISNGHSISELLDISLESLSSLEKKGFVKLADNKIFLRDKAKIFFNKDEDLFLVWLSIYPNKVTKRSGGKRALSPSSADTILGKRLKSKWREVLRNNVGKQEIAIKVLELQVKDMTKSGDLEYMVEAHRWLNEGYHEKYSYLLDEEKPHNNYSNEDYL